ncbi:MAG: biotin/lipoyl-containing protein [Planctomycetota bacterium]
MSGRTFQRTWRVGARTFSADLRLEADRLVGLVRGPDGEQAVDVRVHRSAPDAVVVRMNGDAHRAVLARQGTTVWVALDGHTWELDLESPGGRSSRIDTECFATSPMTGVLLDVAVKPGDKVEEGQTLYVVEAMKMEYAVRAPRHVVIASVRGQKGDKVKVDDPVVPSEGPP